MSRNNKNELMNIQYVLDILNGQQDLNKKTDARLNEHEERLEFIESHAEITTVQAKELKQSVARKVYSLLTVEEKDIYSRKLFGDCWRYLRNHGCGHPYTTTAKKDYKRVQEALKNYNPDISVIKIEHDLTRKNQLANDKRLLEELGYKS